MPAVCRGAWILRAKRNIAAARDRWNTKADGFPTLAGKQVDSACQTGYYNNFVGFASLAGGSELIPVIVSLLSEGSLEALGFPL